MDKLKIGDRVKVVTDGYMGKIVDTASPFGFIIKWDDGYGEYDENHHCKVSYYNKTELERID